MDYLQKCLKYGIAEGSSVHFLKYFLQSQNNFENNSTVEGSKIARHSISVKNSYK